MSKARSLVVMFALALGVVGVSSTAMAEAKEASAAPAKKVHARKTIQGTFEKYVTRGKGHVVGLKLKDGTIVRVPRRASQAVKLTEGDAISIEGEEHTFDAKTIITRAVVKKGTQTVFDATAIKGHRHGKGKKAEK